MIVSLSMKSTDGGEITQALGKIQRATEHIFDSPAGTRIEGRIREQTKHHFETEGSWGRTGKWAALSPDYARRKARARPGAPILVYDDRLRDSVTIEGHPDSVITREPMHLFYGSDVPYGHYHQDGEGQIRRPVFSPTEHDVRDWMQEIHRYFDQDVFKGYGRGRTPSVQEALVGA